MTLILEYDLDTGMMPTMPMGEQKIYFYFFKRPERYSKEVLSHSLICLPLPYMAGIVLICNIGLYCVIAIFSGTGDMFNGDIFTH